LLAGDFPGGGAALYGHPVHASRSNSLAEQNRVYVVACPEAIIAAFAFAPSQYTTASTRPYGSAPTWKSSSSNRAGLFEHRPVS